MPSLRYNYNSLIYFTIEQKEGVLVGRHHLLGRDQITADIDMKQWYQ
jgi:hypothetical protein